MRDNNNFVAVVNLNCNFETMCVYYKPVDVLVDIFLFVSQ